MPAGQPGSSESPSHSDGAPDRGVAPRLASRLLAASLLLSGALPAAAAEYRLDVGDVIEISIARIPTLQRRIPIQLDGTVSFPLLGSVIVAGLTPRQAEVKIQSGLATKVYQASNVNGPGGDIVIQADEVSATVVEYRPIYVDGDVSRPGEFAYRPRMTVRQAVALSGGYDTLRYRAVNPILEGADLRSDYESLWTDLAKERAHIARIRAELADKNDFDQTALTKVPLPRSTLSEILQVESEALHVRQRDRQRQKAFLQSAVKQGNEQIAVLSEQRATEQKGVQADAEELQRSLDLYSKGTLTSPRVTDARRAVLLSSSRALQTNVQLIQLKRQQDEISRQLEQLDDVRRVELLRELQDSQVRLAEIRAKLQGVGDKLEYTSLLKSRVARGNGSKAEIAVIRKSGDARERLETTEDTELQPGDVVEISLRGGGTATAASD
jgi:polysaccharide export outer membrane protein